MEIEFIPDVGFRLIRDGKSLVLAATTVGKPDKTLTDRQIVALSKALSNYDSGVNGFTPLRFVSAKLTSATAPRLADDVAYKFTDDAGLAYWLRGSIQLNPPTTYLTIENPQARDIREGRGLVYLQGPSRFATVTSMSGFNSLIICTSQDARKTERAVRTAKFGKRIIKINRATEFAARVATLSGAHEFTVRDVVYSDAKAVKARSDFADHFVQFHGTGDLTDAALSYIAENWIDELIRVTVAASIFTKPVFYWPERERRIQFVFPSDVPKPRVVEDPSLSRFLEVVV